MKPHVRFLNAAELLNIKADFDISEQTLQVILDDFFLWVKNLAGLQSLTFIEPKITLTLCNDNQAFLQQSGIKADISLTKVYCATESDNVYYIRNDFFEYKTYSQKRINGQYYNLKGKNYYRVAYSPIKYNINAEQQGDYLRYILRNVSVVEYNDFRANQLEIIIEALNSRCVIGVLPTGAGKSLCYQISSLLIPFCSSISSVDAVEVKYLSLFFEASL